MLFIPNIIWIKNKPAGYEEIAKKENKVLQFFYNVMFGCGLLGGALTFLYPFAINGNYPIYHFFNLQTIITHVLLIVSPILIVKFKDFKVEFKNVWQLFIYYIAVGSIALSASMCGNLNFAFTMFLNWMPLNVPFPYHIFVIMAVLVAFEAVVYALFELFRYLKNKKNGVVIKKKNISKIDLAITIFMYAITLFIACVIYAIIAINVWHGQATLWGLLELFSLVYLVFGTLYSNYYSRYITTRFDTERTAKHILLILCFCVLNLPAGIAYLIRFTTACKHQLQH